MSTSVETDVAAVVQAATLSGARPFKNATGDWASAVEVALLDTILSIGAQIDGAYGTGVLPRLRAFKAFRGQANMMRVVATLGPFGLADFVPEQSQIDQLMEAAGQLLDAGIHAASDVDPASDVQRHALISTTGVPEIAWQYFLIALGHQSPELAKLKDTWLDQFVQRAIGYTTIDPQQRDVLLQAATAELDTLHQRKSYGTMPTFTVPQLQQAIFRAEYARVTA
ncbi:MAG TPA: hypothetical protein VIG67_05315 [Yaniella sp.]